MKKYFSPYMVQIIKITSDWRLGEMNEREFINSVTRIADTYADYKKDRESEEEWKRNIDI